MRLALVTVALVLSGVPALGQTQYFGVTGGGPYNLAVTSIKEARFRATLRQQYDFSCGSAALATLLTHHYGLATTEESAFEAMFQQGNQAKIRQEGFSLLDMKMFLEARGFKADGFEASLDELEKAATPAIALISEKGYNHFVVIKGIKGERILIGDPATGRRTVSRKAFEQVWQNGLLFLIHDSPRKAVFNSEREWRLAPVAPLEAGIDRGSLASTMLTRRGPGDY